MASDWQDTLTAREAQCLRLVLELQTNDAIARELDLSTNTVRNHVKAARDKLGGLGRYDAARRYVSLTSLEASPSKTSPERIMAEPVPMVSVEETVRGEGGPEEGLFREARAEFAHDVAAYVPLRPTTEGSERTNSTLLRLLAVPAAAALMALLVVATPPMANSFKQLARFLIPFFK
jgi:DNA-binding CsgD family transcriptional regulator